MLSRRILSSRFMSLPDRPVAAATPFAMPLTQSFDQRSPQRLVVGLTVSIVPIMSASSSSRLVMRPCSSPAR